jgi:hypothetical protein
MPPSPRRCLPDRLHHRWVHATASPTPSTPSSCPRTTLSAKPSPPRLETVSSRSASSAVGPHRPLLHRLQSHQAHATASMPSPRPGTVPPCSFSSIVRSTVAPSWPPLPLMGSRRCLPDRFHHRQFAAVHGTHLRFAAVVHKYSPSVNSVLLYLDVCRSLYDYA